MHDYQRANRIRLAAAAAQTPYDEALQAIQTAFVGALGEGVYDYIKTLHGRLAKRSPWSGVSGFQSWDYGAVRSSAVNLHEIRVYQKDISVYPDSSIDPVLNISVEFLSPSIGVLVRAGREEIYSKTLRLSVTPSHLALGIGVGWEKRITGTVEWD